MYCTYRFDLDNVIFNIEEEVPEMWAISLKISYPWLRACGAKTVHRQDPSLWMPQCHPRHFWFQLLREQAASPQAASTIACFGLDWSDRSASNWLKKILISCTCQSISLKLHFRQWVSLAAVFFTHWGAFQMEYCP